MYNLFFCDIDLNLKHPSTFYSHPYIFSYDSYSLVVFENMNELKRPFDFIYTAVRIGSFYYFFVNCKAVEIFKKSSFYDTFKTWYNDSISVI